jgi:hypothetical protein
MWTHSRMRRKLHTLSATKSTCTTQVIGTIFVLKALMVSNSTGVPFLSYAGTFLKGKRDDYS